MLCEGVFDGQGSKDQLGSISSDWALPGDGDGIIDATKAHVFTRLETEFEASCHCMLIIGFV